MKPSLRWCCILGCLLTALLGNTIGADLVPADAELKLQQRVMALATDLRCVVCQNQSLADSSASLANDLRAEIATMLRAGKSEADVTAFMVQRYGDFVLYQPPLQPSTWLLWLGPLLIMLLALVMLYRHMLGAQRVRPVDGESQAAAADSADHGFDWAEQASADVAAHGRLQ